MLLPLLPLVKAKKHWIIRQISVKFLSKDTFQTLLTAQNLRFSLSKRLQTGAELFLILFLSFNTLWNLIDLEKSFEWALTSVWLLIAVLIYSICRTWTGFKEVGIRIDNLGASLAKGIFWPLVFVFACIGFLGFQKKPLAIPEPSQWLGFPLAGIIQQFFFLGFFYNHYETVFRRAWIAGFLAAATFALYHLPNPGLMAATFLGGLYLSFFYARYRNLLAAGILHGLISLALTLTLEPAGMIQSYNVGPTPLKGLRAAVHQRLEPETQLAAYQSSSIPSSYFESFDRPVYRLTQFHDYEDLLKSAKPVLIAIPKDVQDGFAPQLRAPFQVVGKYNVWKRKFPNQYRLTLLNALTFNIPKLKGLYRREVLLVSNRLH